MTKLQPCAQASPYLQEIRERERAFLERAQRGEDIRNEVILSLQPTIQRMASRLYSRLAPQSRILKSIEQADLVQEASARMLAQFPKALTQDEPFRWLAGVAYGAMRDCLNGRGDTIKRLHSREKPVSILHLDWPLTEDGETLADILPDDQHRSASISEHVQSSIEQALAALPGKQRIVVERYFGFHSLPLSLNEISRALSCGASHRPSNAFYHYKRALAALRQTLSETYSHQQTRAAGGTHV